MKPYFTIDGEYFIMTCVGAPPPPEKQNLLLPSAIIPAGVVAVRTRAWCD